MASFACSRGRILTGDDDVVERFEFVEEATDGIVIRGVEDHSVDAFADRLGAFGKFGR
jgi:hypothetical protein